MLPKVSILIPCYNSQLYLDETIESCLGQSYENIEIIIVDDGSSDKSYLIAQKFESRDRRISVYRTENKGACHARNFGFKKSTGDYIMYLDADDVLSCDKIGSQMVLLMSSDDLDISTCAWGRFYEHISDAVFLPQKTFRDYDSSFDMLLDLWNNSEMFQTSCYIVSRRIIEKAGLWDESLKKNQDGEFFSRVLMSGRKVLFSDKAKVFYRTGENNNVSRDGSRGKVDSLLKSFILYKKNILAVEDSIRVRTALTYNFSLFCYLYCNKYPDLAERAKSEVTEMGLKLIPVGSRRFVKIAKIFGFENLLRIRGLLFNR